MYGSDYIYIYILYGQDIVCDEVSFVCMAVNEDFVMDGFSDTLAFCCYPQQHTQIQLHCFYF